jgi:MauM/NapG family ferredoxin protein
VSSPRDFSRRELFGLLRRSRPDRPNPEAPPRRGFLRPPGALAEERFADACQRCRRCVEICPRQCIVSLPAASGRDAGTPAIFARQAPCVLCQGLECTTVCPSGALSPIALGEVAMGLAVVEAARCLPFRGRPCTACRDACPVPGALRLSDAGRPQVDAARCTGCGGCEYVCPEQPAAIRVVPAGAAAS